MNNDSLKMPNIKDLLLADHQYFSEALLKNEESGEKRINLYITLLTAVPTAIVALAEKNSLHILEDKGVQGILLAAFAALFPFGMFTFLRLVKRNSVTDEFKFALDNIRQQYKDIHDPSSELRLPILPYEKNPMVTPEEEKARKTELKKTGEGRDSRKWVSLVYLVLLLNTMVIAALLSILFALFSITFFIGAVPILIVVLILIFLQVRVINKSKKKTQIKIDMMKFSHSGGIVFKRDEGGFRYLITTSMMKADSNFDVIFPRGHIKKGEEIAEAAIREVYEESGVLANIVRPAGEYFSGLDHVKLYLMESLYEGTAGERRNSKWSGFEEAIKELTYPESKRVLIQMHSFLLATKGK